MRKGIGKKKIRALPVCLCAAAFCITACSPGTDSGENSWTQTGDQEPARTEFFAMDTYMTFTAYGDGAEQALALQKKGKTGTRCPHPCL